MSPRPILHIENYGGNWEPIGTAPRDGRVVELTWMEAGRPQEIYPMRWDPTATNGLFPGARGFWVLDGGGATWNEAGDGGPTHWRPIYNN